MDKQRKIELGQGTKALTSTEILQGYHFCFDWDGLVVGPEDRELECCTCHWEDPEMEEKMEKARAVMRKKFR